MDAVLPSSQTYYFDMPAQISIKIVAALISVQPHPAKSNALARYDVAKLEITLLSIKGTPAHPAGS